MRSRKTGLVLLLLTALPAVAPANETWSVINLPPFRVRRVVRADDPSLDGLVRTHLNKATVTLEVAVNGVSVETLDLGLPSFKRGPFFMYEFSIDVQSLRLKEGDRLTITVTSTDGRVTNTATVGIRVLAGDDTVVIEPPGGVTGP